MEDQVPVPLHVGKAKLALESLEGNRPRRLSLSVLLPPVCPKDEQGLGRMGQHKIDVEFYLNSWKMTGGHS